MAPGGLLGLDSIVGNAMVLVKNEMKLSSRNQIYMLTLFSDAIPVPHPLAKITLPATGQLLRAAGRVANIDRCLRMDDAAEVRIAED